MKKKYPPRFFLIICSLLLITNTALSQTTYNITDPELLEDQTYVAVDLLFTVTSNTDFNKCQVNTEARYAKLKSNLFLKLKGLKKRFFKY